MTNNDFTSLDYGRPPKLILCKQEAGNYVLSRAKSVIEALETVTTNKIVTESSLGSYEMNMDDILKRAHELNKEIWVLPTDKTDRFRRIYGMKKSDEEDAILIHLVYQNHPDAFRQLKSKKHNIFIDKLYKEWAYELIDMRRYAKYEGPMMEKYIPYLPKSSDIPSELKHFLIDKEVYIGKPSYRVEYRNHVLYACLVAALGVIENGGNRGDFDRALSITSFKRPSIFRANMLNQKDGAVTTQFRKELKSLGSPFLNKEKLEELKEVNEEKYLESSELQKATHKRVKRDLRRATRWIFFHVKTVYKNLQNSAAVGISHPTGHS